MKGPLGDVIRMPSERREVCAALLTAQGSRREAAELYKQAVQEQPDDWSGLQLYMDCTLPPECSSGLAAPVSFLGVARALQGLTSSNSSGGSAGGSCGGEGAASQGVDAAAAAAAVEEAEAFLDSLPSVPPITGESGDGGSRGEGGRGQRVKGAGAVLRGPALARVELAARRLKLELVGQRAVAEAVLACYER